MRRFLCAFVFGFLTTFGWAFSPLSNLPKPPAHLEAKLASASAIIIANLPLIANAVEDDYEYGAVNAPIGLAWGVGVLAIATALLPIALRGGETAFEEIRERDQDTFGKNNKDVLKKRK